CFRLSHPRCLHHSPYTTLFRAESSLGLYAQEEVAPLDWLRFVAGFRADYFGFDVTDRLQELPDTVPVAESGSGTRSASIFSPKFNAIIGPFAKTELYLNYGQGLHSNDARGVQQPPAPCT